MATPRCWHAAFLLDATRVLVAGGASGIQNVGCRGVDWCSAPVDTAELFDPVTEEWVPTGSMAHPRIAGEAAQKLKDGSVLFSGAWYTLDGATGTQTEVYDPASGTWHDVGEMPGHQVGTTVLLRSGRVLSVGGVDVDGGASAEVAIFDPGEGTWRPLAPLQTPLYNANLIVLETGEVLLYGGCDGIFVPCPSPVPLEAKLFEPDTETWRSASPMHYPRYPANRQAARLPSGRWLVVGGNTSIWDPDDPSTARPSFYRTPAAEIYDPRLDEWRVTPVMPHYVNGDGAVAVLESGAVIYTGGTVWDGNRPFLNPRTFAIPTTQIFRE